MWGAAQCTIVLQRAVFIVGRDFMYDYFWAFQPKTPIYPINMRNTE